MSAADLSASNHVPGQPRAAGADAGGGIGTGTLRRDAGLAGLAFSAVLVANRGEIAVRIIRTLRDLGIRSIAVYSDADAGARHVREADVAVRLGPTPARESYLDIDAVLEAAQVAGAQAIHPGYGFLAENAAFVRACEAAGLFFIGPPAAAVEVMGDKIVARRTVAEVGVAVVPGRSSPAMTDAAITEAAGQLGYPVLVKPSAGGGGKGMRVVRAPGEMAAALVSARREASAAFDDDALFVERLIARPRHVEVQVLADAHGTVLHLGERECSLQRRHQKIIEEAPSPLLDARTRERLGAAAVAVAGAVGYVGAGTVEFILSADAPDEFYFMEMNTRLQVEHAVTELVTGVDLVAEQIRIAAGEPLRFGQADVRLAGHAVEARVYAEDPARGFLPTGGHILAFREPAGPAIRVDAGIAAGDTVGTAYDPMLAKIVAWGPDRPAAIARLDAALAATVLLGVTTNIGFLRALLGHPDVVAGRLDTDLVERDLAALTADELPAEAILGYALARLLALQPLGPLVDPWDIPSGWRPGEPAWLSWDVLIPGGGTGSARGDGSAGDDGPGDDGPGDDAPAGSAAAGGDSVGGGVEEAAPAPGGGSGLRSRAATVRVSVRGTPAAARIRLADGPPVAASVRQVGDDLLVTIGSITTRWAFAWAVTEGGHDLAELLSAAGPRVPIAAAQGSSPAGELLWLGRDGRAWELAEAVPVAGADPAAVRGGQARSPMPGTVIAVLVEPGTAVIDGQSLVVVEAMKMEHPVSAAAAGIVAEVLVRPGDLVGLDQVLAVVAPPRDVADLAAVAP
ncbi:biotin carboxylase N-terminal domain-containing protein [Frankia gtarii]|uniref:ATP-binding protein n=1 Tax=Frankia gtarii TaxID=2950102 RepID=UPI003F688A22